MSNSRSSALARVSCDGTRLSRGLALAIAAAASGHARGQELLWQVDGTGSEHLGETLATMADLDGDGRREVIAGAPTGNLVRVFSGATGAKLWEWVHSPPSNRFGAAIADAGDVNGDGVADVVVGAPGIVFNETGEAFVYSGFDGSTLLTLPGAKVGDNYGAAVCGLGDVDGDGFGDVAIGAPTAAFGSSGNDRVEVISGQTGQLIYKVAPTVMGDNIGTALAPLDDLDGDGVRDFAVSAPLGRYIEIVSGKGGAILLKIVGPGTDVDLFGRSLATIGDLDGDGFGDLLAGSPWRDFGTNTTAGAAEVYSSVTGALLTRHRGSATSYELGFTVASAGDSNGDGAPDLLVGSYSGYASLYSGATGHLLYRFKADPAVSDGAGVGGSDDFAGDGFDGVVVGAPSGGTAGAGHVEVRRGNDLYVDFEPFEPAAGANVQVTVGDGNPGDLSLLAVVSVNGVPTFMALAIAPLDANGQLVLTGTVPSGLSGLTFDLLGLELPASGPLRVSGIETVVIS